MKLLIILSVLACSHADKLDRTYLPPASAATAGGSPGSLSAPGISPSSPASGVPGTSYGTPVTATSGFTASPFGSSGFASPSSGTPGFARQSSGAPGFTGSSSGTPGFGSPSTGSSGFVGSPADKSGYGSPSPKTPGFGSPASGTPGFAGSSAGSPGFGSPASGTPGFAGLSSGSPGYATPSSSAGFGQTPFGRTSVPAGSQQSVPSFSQQAGSNLPTGSGSTQPSAPGFQAPSSQYGQPAGAPGLAKSGAAGPSYAPFATASKQASSFGQTSQGQAYKPERAQASFERNAEILRYESQNDGNTFAYSFETSNGISAEESGVATNGVRAQGGFSYTDDDGQLIRVTYTADENGYQPQGDHLPTSPPIPEEILRSIEENARAAAAGTQEGAYNPDEDVSGAAPQFRGTSSYPSSGSPAQGAYNRPQGQIPTTLATSRTAVGSPGAQGFGKSGQSATGFGQTGQFASQSGYQYSQPQAGSSFGRASASGPSTGQYRPESPSRTFPGASSQGFAPSGSNTPSFLGSSGSGSSQGFGSAPSSPGSGLGSAPSSPGSGFGSTPSSPGSGFGSAPSSPGSGFGTKPSSLGSGFGQAPGFGQSSQTPGSQPSGQYQSPQAGSKPSMTIPSSSYQYNRPGQQGGLQQGSFGPSGQDQGRPGQPFGSPRQPPTFTEEEGYKY